MWIETFLKNFHSSFKSQDFRNKSDMLQVFKYLCYANGLILRISYCEGLSARNYIFVVFQVNMESSFAEIVADSALTVRF